MKPLLDRLADALREAESRDVVGVNKLLAEYEHASSTPVAAEVGVAVNCTVCGRRKQPIGRDAPTGSSLCNSHDCEGYRQDPQPGDLWPGETREQFGYGAAAPTKDVGPQFKSAQDGDGSWSVEVRFGTQILLIDIDETDAGVAQWNGEKFVALSRESGPKGAEAVAYIQYTPDPEPGIDMSVNVWMLAPGMKVPDGCTPLYTHPPRAAEELPSAAVDLLSRWERMLETGNLSGIFADGVRSCVQDLRALVVGEAVKISREAVRPIIESERRAENAEGVDLTQRFATPTAPVHAQAVTDAIRTMGARIIADGHDNDHCTRDPMFMVHKHVRRVGIDPDYADAHAWLHDGEEITDQEEIAALDKAYDAGEDIDTVWGDSYARTGVVDAWEYYAGPWFTKENAEAFMAAKKHEGELRLYVDSGYRNHEWQAVRALLIALAAPPVERKGGVWMWVADKLVNRVHALVVSAPNVELAPVELPGKTQADVWRCFHCDEVFTDADAAMDHFGPSLCSEPACKIDAAEYRRMEEQVRRCNAEDSDKDRAIYGLRAHHAVMLIREEERGYARGLDDARKELAASLPGATAAADAWTPSGIEYDRAIHHNPDAKAWADLFVATFPGLADKHGLMLGWFANAMMAMHDSQSNTKAGELKRLRAIEHHCWHLLDDSEDDGEYTRVHNDISKRDLDALNELLPEGHPEVDAIAAPPVELPGGAVDPCPKCGRYLPDKHNCFDSPTAPVHAQAVTEEMVNRFLSWPLPDSVQPDGCIGRGQRAGDDRLKWGYPLVGTNLLTADQAREMLEHVLAVPAKHETAVAFWLKHAMGGLSAPVCFGCGQPWETWKGCTRHAELPDIYLCAECARNCKTLAEAPVLVYRPSDEIAKDRSPDDQRGTK